MTSIIDLLEDNPIIAAVKNEEGLEVALRSDSHVVFILYGNIITIKQIVDRVKEKGKLALVHVELLDGVSHKKVVLDFLKQQTAIDGIISTKTSMIRAAKNHGLITVHRVFLVDSMAFNTLPKVVEQSKPDLIEVMPGCMPKVIQWVQEKTKIPLIAGGLVCEKEDVMNALNAGALAIGTTNWEVWKM